MVDTIKIEESKTELIPILRWEEDGGTIIEFNESMPDRLVIEPFQARTRIDLVRRKAPTKRPSM